MCDCMLLLVQVMKHVGCEPRSTAMFEDSLKNLRQVLHTGCPLANTGCPHPSVQTCPITCNHKLAQQVPVWTLPP